MLSNEEPRILEEYLEIVPDLKKIYVIPSIHRGGRYFRLLYGEILEKSTDIELRVDSLRVSQQPLCTLRKLLGEHNLLHYHWYEFNTPRQFLIILWITFNLIVYRILGGSLVWTIHNKYPHRRKLFLLNKWFRRLMARLANRIHVHCQAAIEIMSQILSIGKSKFFVQPHPPFKIVQADHEYSLEKVIQEYGIPIVPARDSVFLMFGTIMKYKGVLSAAEEFTKLSKNMKLVVAGKTRRDSLGYVEKIKEIAKNSENIYVIDRFIPDNQVPYFFNAADYVLFNYKDILTSGAVILARNYGRPIVAPKIGCIRDLEDEDDVFLFEENKGLWKTLKKLAQSTSAEKNSHM